MPQCYICGDEHATFVARLGRFCCFECARRTKAGTKAGREEFARVLTEKWGPGGSRAIINEFWSDYMASTECDVVAYLESCSTRDDEAAVAEAEDRADNGTDHGADEWERQGNPGRL